MSDIECKCSKTGIIFDSMDLKTCGCQYGQKVKSAINDARYEKRNLVKQWYKQAEDVEKGKESLFLSYSEQLEEIMTGKEAWVLPYVFEYLSKRNLDIVYQGKIYDISEPDDVAELLIKLGEK